MTVGTAVTVAVTGMNALPDNPGPGLAVARCLREAYGDNIRIVGLSYDALDPGLYLHEYCDSAHLLSYPRNGAAAILARLVEIQMQEKIDVLIPCLDSELPVMVSLAPRLLEMGIRTFLPSAEQLERRAKDRLPELSEIAGVLCPQIHRLTSPGFFKTCEPEGWLYPLVVKGVFYDAKVVHNPEEATAVFNMIASQWGLPVIAQRFVAGEEYNLTAVGDGKGNLLGEVMMKKRAITAKGKAWVGIAIHDDALAATARRLASALNWKGPLEVEAMRDSKGRYQLIEINPRFPAWIYLSLGVGRNLPALLLELALGHATPPLSPPQPGTMFIRYAQETIIPLAAFEALMIDGKRTQPNLRILP
ncbi:MAG: ATP-grasp domain-containing protein [Gammaproteobacteria bacterium]|nr:ATP-grasp domain-containing protein [Gammaproteobacteria bacterium]